MELSELCLRLLAKKPEERPADAQELCTALTALLERQEAAWDAPLCEAFSEYTVTTRLGPGGDEVAHYLKAAREAEARPRRGLRPLVVMEAGSAMPVVEALARVEPPEAPAALPVEPVPPAPEAPVSAPEPVSRALRVRVAVGLTLAVFVGGGVTWFWATSRHTASAPPFAAEAAAEPRSGSIEYTPDVTWEVGRKVAPPWKPPEATGRDFLATEASMKDPQQKQQKGLGPVGKAITTGACITMACTGSQSQVRPEPPAEPCPPGAAKAMAELDINIGDKGSAVFTSVKSLELLSVRDGEWTRLQLVARTLPGNLPAGAILKGRLIFGAERVYGRFTQAQARDGTRTWPVCLELLDRLGERGMEMDSGSMADTAKVVNSAQVKAVEHFEGG